MLYVGHLQGNFIDGVYGMYGMNGMSMYGTIVEIILVLISSTAWVKIR